MPTLVRAPPHEVGFRLRGDTSNIVHLFDKTPPEIVCGPFYEVRWAYGCIFDCAYCYLRGTLRGDLSPRYRPTEKVIAALDKALQEVTKPHIFNTGELADSLMNPTYMAPIIDKFEEQDKHKVFLLSKSSNTRMLLTKIRRQAIVGFSVNAPAVAALWEHRTPPPYKRIEAAAALSAAGYDVRLRIDPIFPIDAWRDHYPDLLDMIFSRFTPKRIILGTPRGLQKTIMYAKDLSWARYLARDETGWGKKLPFALRKEIYMFFYDALARRGFDTSQVTLCKETVSMWEALGLPYRAQTCMCYGRL